MNNQGIKPGRGYYALAAMVFLAGLGFFVLMLWKGLTGTMSKLQQVVAPGKAEITLSESGDYTIFYEHESVIGNRVYSTGEDVSGLECVLVSKPLGTPVELSRSTVDATYSFGGRSGKSVFDFHIDRPGVYELASRYPPGREGPVIVLAVGHGVTMGILTTVFAALGIFFGSIALSLGILVYTLVKRHNAKQRLNTPGAVPPPIE
jgi:hypothetical protein